MPVGYALIARSILAVATHKQHVFFCRYQPKKHSSRDYLPDHLMVPGAVASAREESDFTFHFILLIKKGRTLNQ